MDARTQHTVVVAGGGTGGHLYPAIAVCESMKRLNPNVKIHFVGTARGLEVDIVPRNGYPLELIEVGTLKGRGIFTKVKTLLGLPNAFFQSIKILKKLKPGVVFGVGGYASGPVMAAAAFLKIPRVLFEANAHPGLTNRILARWVNHAFITFADATRFFPESKTKLIGLPVRASLKPVPRTNHEKLRVLVFGGSQGAMGINNTIVKAVEEGQEQREPWVNQIELVHQTGKVHFKNLSSRYSLLRMKNIEVAEFLHDMDKRYAWADLVVCRAGASTLQELACCQKASVLVPFPFASDDHQRKNAEAFSKKNAAILVVQKDFTPARFKEIVQDFLSHPEKIKSLEKEVSRFYVPQSAEKIAASLLGNL